MKIFRQHERIGAVDSPLRIKTSTCRKKQQARSPDTNETRACYWQALNNSSSSRATLYFNVPLPDHHERPVRLQYLRMLTPRLLRVGGTTCIHRKPPMKSEKTDSRFLDVRIRSRALDAKRLIVVGLVARGRHKGDK